ncbi:MAG TPA: YIP1 family protein [Acidobacteriota bacterium]|nr:YIP1 family protein [Acidobacteriota bacterium]
MSEPVENREESASGLSGLTGIFFEPGRTFRQIDRNPRWMLPLLASIVVGIAGTLLILQVIDMTEIFRNEMLNSPQGRNMTAEQIDEMAAQLMQSPWVKAFQFLGPVFLPILTTLLVGGLLMALLPIIGGDAPFRKVFSVVTHGYFFYYAVATFLAVLVYHLSPEPNSIHPQNPVFTNPGGLFNRREDALLYQLASSVDLLSFYRIYLIGVGLSVVAKGLSRAGGIMASALPYALYVLITVAWTALTG